MIRAADCGWFQAIRIVHDMTIMTIIGSGVASAVVSFGPAALAAGAVLGSLLLVTATVLVVADACSAV
jgi:hypothetical protein